MATNFFTAFKEHCSRVDNAIEELSSNLENPQTFYRSTYCKKNNATLVRELEGIVELKKDILQTIQTNEENIKETESTLSSVSTMAEDLYADLEEMESILKQYGYKPMANNENSVSEDVEGDRCRNAATNGDHDENDENDESIYENLEISPGLFIKRKSNSLKNSACVSSSRELKLRKSTTSSQDATLNESGIEYLSYSP